MTEQSDIGKLMDILDQEGYGSWINTEMMIGCLKENTPLVLRVLQKEPLECVWAIATIIARSGEYDDNLSSDQIVAKVVELVRPFTGLR